MVMQVCMLLILQASKSQAIILLEMNLTVRPEYGTDININIT